MSARQGHLSEPVAWRRMNSQGTQSTGVTDTEYYRDLWIKEGSDVRALYAHPDAPTRQAIAAAYEAGATDAHNDWLNGSGERGARISEAALDYADAVLGVPVVEKVDDTFRDWLKFSINAARFVPDALDPKAAGILTNVLARYDARQS